MAQPRRTAQPGKPGPRPRTEAPGLRVTVDGLAYVVRESDISPHDVRALRAATGMSWSGLAKGLATDPDIDLIAALVWFARHLAGDRAVTYEQVLDGVSYDSDIDVAPDAPLQAVGGDLAATGTDDLPEA